MHSVQPEQLLILLDDGVFRLGKHAYQCIPIQVLQGSDYRETAYQFGDEPEFQQIFRGNRLGGGRGVGLAAAVGAGVSIGIGEETHAGAGGKAAGGDFVQSVKSAAANKKNVAGVNLQHLLMGVLAAALGGYIGDAALNDFEEFLLDAFAGHIAGYGTVHALFAGDFVQFVNVDDALLGAGNIPFGGLDQAQQYVFNILADIPGFGKRGSVADGERDVQGAGQGFGEQGFAGAGGADQQNVGFLNFYVGGGQFAADTLEMVVHRYGQGLFGLFLADDIGVQVGVDFTRDDGRRRFRRGRGRRVGGGQRLHAVIAGAAAIASFGQMRGQLFDAVKADAAA